MYSFDKILERLKGRLNNPASTIEGTFTMDNLEALSRELEQIHAIEIASILDAIFWDSATGANLDRRALDIQLERHAAQPAIGQLRFEGRAGSAVPMGTLARYDSLVYATTEAAVIAANGFVTAAAECQTAGTAGNVPAGVVTIMVSRPDGITSVSNPVPFGAGSNRETDEDFRARCMERLRYPDTSGNEYYYEFRAKEVPGIGKARCTPTWAGAGTVKLTLLTSEGTSPDEALIDKVRQHVEAYRLIGADITYIGAVPLPVNISGQLVLAPGYSIEDVTQAARQEFEGYFAQIAFDKATTYLSYHKAVEMLFRVPGVLDIAELQLNGQQGQNVDIGADEYPVLQEVDLSAT